MPTENNSNKKIIFISSYMKSGNTWVRSIISSLSNKGSFKLSDLKDITLYSQKSNFANIPQSKCLYDEGGNIDFDFTVNNWINAQINILDKTKKQINFFKTHSSRGMINGKFFTNSDVCSGFIYLIRDPRDIAISYARHMDIDINESIDIMLYKKNFMTKVMKVFEPVTTWKEHIISWTSFKSVPRLIMKYENMIDDNYKTVESVANFLYLVSKQKYFINKENIIKAVENTKFDNLKQLEKSYGFNEAIKSNFFRKGKSNQWEVVLTKKQTLLIESELRDPMKKLGYL